MIECHCGKCDRLATKHAKLKERVAELEDWKVKAEDLHDKSLDLVMETWDEKLGVQQKRVAELEATILEMCEHFDLPNVEDFIGGVTGVPKFRYMYLKTER